jgi:serine/threonine protein kinase
MSKTEVCLDGPAFLRLIREELPEAERRALEAHVLACPACAAVYEQLNAARRPDTPSDVFLVDTNAGADAAEPSAPGSASGPAPSSGAEAGPSPTPWLGGAGWRSVVAGLAILGTPQAEGEVGRLGPYRVLKPLGWGGMGIVFKAEEPALRRHVALKVIKAGLAASASQRGQFVREMRLMAKLDNPDHLMPILFAGEERGAPFFAMPLLKGQSLEEHLQEERRPLPLPLILQVGREAAAGLESAHQAGIIHRDVKPSNIFLEARAPGVRVRVLDFGIAALVSAPGSAPGDGSGDWQTPEGVVVGTVGYLAPEAVQGGQDVGPAADLFSLGCVLYRLCTGRLPFRSGDVLSYVADLEKYHPRAPAELNPDVPAALSDLVLRLLARRPEDRPGSAREVEAALKEIEAAGPPVTRRVRPSQRPQAVAGDGEVASGPGDEPLLLRLEGSGGVVWDLCVRNGRVRFDPARGRLHVLMHGRKRSTV